MLPVGAWAPAVAFGLAHSGRRPPAAQTHRAAACCLLVAVTSMFLCGLMMRGTMFQPQNGDMLTTLINTGGFVGDVCSGILYLLAVWLGYSQPDAAGAVHDYGTKFLVTAGLLNLLAIVDAFEIASGRKD